MAKAALITDLHFGARNDSDIFRRFIGKFYEEVFFPYIDKHNIKWCVDLGDTFDRRKFVNFNTLSHAKKVLFQPLYDREIITDVIVGNHDIFWKNTNEVNSPDLLLSDFKNLRIHQEISSVDIGGTSVTMIPWINGENEKAVMAYMAADDNRIAMGHLEVAGFEMDPGIVCTEGYDANLFKKYDMVLTGHFHHKSTKGNLTYLGNPYELTWADYGDIRGFHILDTETQELEFIPNPNRMFYKVYYNDENGIPELPEEKLEEKYVKIVLAKKTNPIQFDKFFESIYSQNPADLQIVDPAVQNLDVEMTEDDMKNAVKDSRQFLRDYVSEVKLAGTEDDNKKLADYMDTLYTEALNEC